MNQYDLKSRFVPQWPQATRQRSSDQPVPSVAWSAATLTAKRTQGVRSRVMEPRKDFIVRAASVILGCPQYRSPAIARDVDLAGVKEYGARTERCPGTWEVSHFHRNAGGLPAEQTQAPDRARGRRERIHEPTMVPPREGNEVRAGRVKRCRSSA